MNNEENEMYSPNLKRRRSNRIKNRNQNIVTAAAVLSPPVRPRAAVPANAPINGPNRSADIFKLDIDCLDEMLDYLFMDKRIYIVCQNMQTPEQNGRLYFSSKLFW